MCFTTDKIERACGLVVLNEFDSFVYCCKSCHREFGSGSLFEAHIRTMHQSDKEAGHGSSDAVRVAESMECEPTNKRTRLTRSKCTEPDKRNTKEPNIGESSSKKATIAKVNVPSPSPDIFVNDQPQAAIFKLKMDHFENIFDYLSLEDLILLGHTCKRMQRYVGYCLKTNYTATKFELKNDMIRTGVFNVIEMKYEGWSSFMKKMVLPVLESVRYDYCARKWRKSTGVCVPQMNPDHFESLTEIQLKNVMFTDKGLSRIKGILSQLETVKLNSTNFFDANKEFYAHFLQYCTKLKELSLNIEVEISNDEPIIGVDNTWLQRKYPTLEQIEIIVTDFGDQTYKINEFTTFFEKNIENLKRLVINDYLLLSNQNIFLKTKLKLDILSIKLKYSDRIESSRELLNKLYECEFFKELHVYYYPSFERDSAPKMALFNGLTKLFIKRMLWMDTNLSSLIQLKQLCIAEEAAYIANMDTFAQTLVKLESIHFKDIFVKNILSFIRYSPNLHTIVPVLISDSEILKIKELNEERSKLINAKKVTIYVAEDVYLRTKQINNETSFSLVEIKRSTSCDALDHCFDCTDVFTVY